MLPKGRHDDSEDIMHHHQAQAVRIIRMIRTLEAWHEL